MSAAHNSFATQFIELAESNFLISDYDELFKLTKEMFIQFAQLKINDQCKIGINYFYPLVMHFFVPYGIKETLIQLNQKDPQLKVEDVTQSTPTTSLPPSNETHERIFIKFDTEMLFKHIVPLLEKHIRLFPFPFKNISKTAEGLASTHGLSAIHSDCYEETLCQVIQESYLKTDTVNFVLQHFFSHSLISIIHGYLNFQKHENKEEIKKLVSTKSKFQFFGNENKQTRILITAPQNAAQLAIKFFNKAQSNSAYIDEKIEDKDFSSKPSSLVINNEMLLHPGLISDMNDTLSQFSVSEISRFYVQQLRRIMHEKSEIKLDRNLMLSTKKLIEQLENKIENDDKIEPLIRNVEQDLKKSEKNAVDDLIKEKLTIIRSSINSLKKKTFYRGSSVSRTKRQEESILLSHNKAT